jgi:putative DNA primase/helicase
MQGDQANNLEAVRNGKGNSVALARFFMEEYRHLALDMNRELFIYDKKGIYKDVDDKYFDELFMLFLKKNGITESWKLNKINEVKRAVFAMGKLPRVEFDAYQNFICFKNCVIDLDKMKKYSLSPEYYFTTKVNVDYLVDAEPAIHFSKFLETTFTNNDGSPDVDTINNIIRIGGYLLYPKNRLKKMFLFLGEGANGKSTLINIFEMFFDRKNVSHIDLDTLSSTSSKERNRLIGSRLNTTTEAKSNKLDSEIIKQVISSESIPINRKFRDSVDYKPLTKLIIASNTQPYFNDTTHGLYRRIFPISFRNRFVPEAEYNKTKMAVAKRIFIEKNDVQLERNLFNERSGILNLFLGGLRDLRNKKWQLKMSKNSDDTLKEYKNTGDSISHFLIKFYCEDTAEECYGLTAEEVLSDYREWYRANVSERPLNYSVQSLGRKIKELWRIETFRRYVKGNKRESFYPLKRKVDDYNEEISNNGDNSQTELDI